MDIRERGRAKARLGRSPVVVVGALQLGDDLPHGHARVLREEGACGVVAPEAGEPSGGGCLLDGGRGCDEQAKGQRERAAPAPMTAGCSPCSMRPCWISTAALRHGPLRRITRPTRGDADPGSKSRGSAGERNRNG